MIDRIIVGELETNCYLLADENSKKCAVIDPGGDFYKIRKHIDRKGFAPVFIINTHGHADHILSDDEFNLPIYIHEDDAGFLTDPQRNLSGLYGGLTVRRKPDMLLKDGDTIELSSLMIKVIHTPGHTPGGICLLCEDILFSGDTLFAAGVGRTDLPGGDEAKLIHSIEKKLYLLDENIKVFPGHGGYTTIGREKRSDVSPLL
ncbi:MAG: MBL fold metallo-hydrolase [Candidatus Omnitrophica bacterium]|nr:MBL fold metallo-hydrolase [Candidatus Omnitrophota bacterium]